MHMQTHMPSHGAFHWISSTTRDGLGTEAWCVQGPYTLLIRKLFHLQVGLSHLQASPICRPLPSADLSHL